MLEMIRVADGGINTANIANNTEFSRGLIYRYIKNLIEMDAIEKSDNQLVLTDFGEILLL